MPNLYLVSPTRINSSHWTRVESMRKAVVLFNPERTTISVRRRHSDWSRNDLRMWQARIRDCIFLGPHGETTAFRSVSKDRNSDHMLLTSSRVCAELLIRRFT